MRISPVQTVVCLVGFAEAVVYGYSFPYFSLILEARGESATLIGANAMIGTFGALVVGPFVPGLITRLGYRQFSFGAFCVAAAAFSGVLINDSTPALFGYRLLLGLALASLWISTEAWLNHVAADESRGLLNGIFQTGYSFGFFLGPSLAGITYGSPSTGALCAVAILAAGCLLCLSLRGSSGQADGEFDAPLDWSVAWNARGLLAIALLTGIAETAMYTLLPVYGLHVGMVHQSALGVLVFYTFGEVILTLPLAWLADRVNRRRLLTASAAAAALCVLAIGLSGNIAAYAQLAAFFAGGMVVSLYNLALVVVGEQYRGTNLPVVSTAFSMAYSIGCASGATIGGVAMDLTGPYGLPLAVGATLAVFALASAVVFERGRAAPGQAKADTLL